jgi:hypothetical protein
MYLKHDFSIVYCCVTTNFIKVSVFYCAATDAKLANSALANTKAKKKIKAARITALKLRKSCISQIRAAITTTRCSGQHKQNMKQPVSSNQVMREMDGQNRGNVATCHNDWHNCLCRAGHAQPCNKRTTNEKLASPRVRQTKATNHLELTQWMIFSINKILIPSCNVCNTNMYINGDNSF